MSDNLDRKFIVPIEWPRTDAEHAENWRHLSRFTGEAVGTRWATFVVAASNSTAEGRETADYLCDGAGDNEEIQAAITACGAQGRVLLLEGDFVLSAPLFNGTIGSSEIEIGGMGYGVTSISNATGDAVSVTTGTGRLTLRDMSIESSATAGRAVFAQFSLGLGGSVHLEHCAITAQRIGVDILGGAAHSVLECSITCTENSSASRGLREQNTSGNARYEGNYVTVANGRAIAMNADSSWQSGASVRRNYVTGGAVGIYMVNGSGDGSTGVGRFTDNFVHNAGTGIKLEGAVGMLVQNNMVEDCLDGIVVGGGGAAIQNNYNFVTGNYVNRPTGTAGIWVTGSGVGHDYNVIMFNRVVGTGATYGIRNQGLGTTVAFNDLFQSDPFSDAGTGTKTEPDFILGPLSVAARVGVRKNSGGSTYERRRINLIEGPAISIAIADDSTNEEVDTTITVSQTALESGGAAAITGNLDGNARVGIRKNSTGTTFLRRRVNLIEGAGITITISDDSGSEEVDVILAASGGGGSGFDLYVNGVLVGSQPIVNFISGSGVSLAGLDTGTEIDLTVTSVPTAGQTAGKVFTMKAMR